MKILLVSAVVLFLTSRFLCQVYAIELCESQDYYNLADSSKCTLKNNHAVSKSNSQESMFEILKNYPYENKDKFIKLLQRKIELVDNSLAQQKIKILTDRSKTNISKLEQVKQNLSEQFKMVDSATRENWVDIRDQARKVLEEAAKRLHEVD
jgi:hypothetical protein